MKRSRNNGTTFFASLSKFTKEVGRMVARRRRARRQRALRKSSDALFFHVRKLRLMERTREGLLFIGREKRTNTEERYYQDAIAAARNRVYAERMECKKHWDVLLRNNALPINLRTNKHWEDFDRFLSTWQEDESSKIYA